MNNHTTAKRGKRVLVVLHTGEHFVDHFEERLSAAYVFRKRGRIVAKRIRSLSIYRHTEGRSDGSES